MNYTYVEIWQLALYTRNAESAMKMPPKMPTITDATDPKHFRMTFDPCLMKQTLDFENCNLI